jgi:uncharacterized membrane protein YesL
MEGFMKGILSVSEWIMRLMYVNILWIVFTLLGLVILGFFPATTAMFAVVRKWVMKEELPVFKTFWTTYKSEFLRSNLLGLLIFVFGFFMYSNIKIVESTTVPLLKLVYIPNVISILIYSLTLLYIFPVLVHFDVGLKDVVKNAIVLMTVNPIATFTMAVLTSFFYFILYQFPGLIPFFSGSVPTFLLMFFCSHVFTKTLHEQQGKGLRGSETPI